MPGNESGAKEINRALADVLQKRGKELVQLQLIPGIDAAISAQIRDCVKHTPLDALVLNGFDHFLKKDADTGELSLSGRDYLQELNIAREYLNSIDRPILIWLTRENLALLGNRAADLFSQRRMTNFYFD